MREKDIAEEIEFHRAMRERKYREQHGMSPQEAVDKAKRDFGGFEKWKEVCRDVERWRLVDELWRDLVFALRMLRKSPVFTVVALLTLTLTIGANTAIFSLLNELMLKTLPVPSAQRLVVLRIQPDEWGYTFNYPLYQELEKRSAGTLRPFAFTNRPFQLRTKEGVEQLLGQLVSGSYFSSLGVQPSLGRWITPLDDRPGSPNGMVAVLSDHFWRNRMNGNAQALGKQITINQGSFTVIGVMPKTFRGMSRDFLPDIFVPLQSEPFIDAPFNAFANGIYSSWFAVGAYLSDGVSREQANAFLRTESRHIFEAVLPRASTRGNGSPAGEKYLLAEPGSNGFSFLRFQFQRPLTILMALVAMVLLVGCLNIATLLMARSASRSREISTRFAMGASRLRLLRQLLTEIVLLALTGTLLGLAMSPLLARFLSQILAPQHGPQSAALTVAPDLTVFAFTAVVSILATVLTGMVPALRSTSDDLQGALKESSVAIKGADRKFLLPRVLLIAQVALSLMLVTGACLLGYSLLKLHETPAGFEPRGLVYLPLETEKQALKGEALLSAYRRLTEKMQTIPGVQVVSTTSVVPLSMNQLIADVPIPGLGRRQIWQNTVGPKYFQAMRTPVLQGREFTWADDDASGRKAILNQSAAKLMFPHRSALGQHFLGEDGKTSSEVIGVVANAKYTTIRDAAPPTAYSPVTQDVKEGGSWTLLIRTQGSAAPVIEAARRIVHRAVPDIPLPAAFSLQDTLSESLASERIMAMLALFFGGVALLMTGIGLYGTLAYATGRRTSEIGIRLALGAMPHNVISLVSAENGAIALSGCLIGIAGSIFAARWIASFLYGVSPTDPLVFAVAALLLLGVAAAASLIPAVNASKIDPIAAIRYE